MKKILAITVAIMYLVITSGLVMEIHYCMGKQVGSSLKFAETSSHTCSVCGMQNAKNQCCHDDVRLVKLQDVHQQVNTDYALPAPASILQEYSPANPMFGLLPLGPAICNSASPDDDDGQPSLLILHRMLKI